VAIPGTVIRLKRQPARITAKFRHLKPFHERRDASLSGGRRGPSPRRLKQEVPEAACSSSGRRKSTGLGQRPDGFKLMVERPATSTRRLQAPGDKPGRPGGNRGGTASSACSRLRARTPALRPWTSPGPRAKTMGVARVGRPTSWTQLHGVPGQLLRQRLQPLRPHLAGQHQAAPTSHGRDTVRQLKVRHRRRRHGAEGRWPRCADSAGWLQITAHMFPAVDQRRLVAGGPHPDVMRTMEGRRPRNCRLNEPTSGRS